MSEIEEIKARAKAKARARAKVAELEAAPTIPQQIVRTAVGGVQSVIDQAQAQAIGVGRGLTSAYEGITQPFRGPEFTQEAQAERDLYQGAKAQEPGLRRFQMGMGEIIGETAPYAAIPGAAASAALPARLGAGMAAGGLIGATQFVPPGTTDVARARVAAASRGALTGGGTVLGLEPLRLGAAKAAGAVPPGEQALLGRAEKLDVPLSAGDVRGGPTTKLETMMEAVPVVGMGRFRAKQQTKAQKAAETVTKDFTDRINASWEDVAKTSLNRRLDSLKETADTLYSRVARKADPLGAFSPTTTLNTIDELVLKEKQAILPDAQLIAVIEKMKVNLQKGGTFSQLRDFRSGVSDMISDYYAGSNALVGARGVGKLQELRNSLNGDLESFAKQQGGDVLKSWKAADTFYKQKVIPFREEALIRRLAKEEDPTASYRLFLSAAKQKPDVLFNALGPKGKSAVKAGILNDALEVSLSEKTGFSPAKFAQSLEKRQNEIGVFFKGNDKAEIEGLMKVMRHAERAGQYAENPPTGNRLLPWLLGGALGVGTLAAPTTATVVGGSIYGLTKLLTSKTSRDFLLAASKAEPGPAMQRVIDIYSPRLAATATE